MLKTKILFFLLVALCLALHCTRSTNAQRRPVFHPSVVDYVHSGEIHPLLYLADSLKYDMAYPEAFREYQRLLDRGIEFPEQGYVINQLAFVCLMMQEDSLANVWIKKYAEQADTTNTRDFGDYCFNSGLYAMRQGDRTRALDQFRLSLTAYADVYGNEHLKYALINNQIAWLYLSQSDDPEAGRPYAQIAEGIFNRHPKLEPYRADNYHVKSCFALLDRDYERANDLAEMALAACSQQSPKATLRKALMLCTLAEAQSKLEKSGQASAWSEEAVQMVFNTPYSFEGGALLQKLAMEHLVKSREDEAFIAKIKRYYKQSPLQAGYADWILGFKSYYASQTDSAIVHFEKFIEKCPNASALMLDNIYYTLSLIYGSRGEMEKSTYYAQKDLQIGSEQSKYNFAVYGLLGNNYFEAFQRSGKVSDLVAAEACFHKEETSFLSNLLGFSEASIIQFEHEVGDVSFPKAVETCYLLYKKTQNSIWANKAFAYAERMKSLLMYRDMLTLEHSDQRSYVAWADSTRKLAAAVNRLQFLKKNQKKWTPESQQDLEQAIINLERCNQMRAASSNAYQLAIKQEIPDISSIQKKLVPQEALIQYCIGPNELYAICLSREKFEFCTLGKSATVQEMAARLYREVQKPQLAVKPLADSLGLLLIEPLAQILEGKIDLLIVPDRQLSLLPFELLGWKQKMLLEVFVVSYTPSWKVHAAHSRPKPLDMNGASIGFWADVSLPNCSRIEQAAATSFGPKHFRQFSGEACCKNVFLNKHAEFDVLHLSMHGSSSLSDRRDNKLAFGLPGDTLWGFEVQAQSFHAQLVVLSACQTAFGKNDSGEGAFTLSRSFQQAGVAQVVATLWEVQESATADILAEFYAQLRQNRSPIAALREAKRSYLRNAEGFKKHPYYWAGAVVLN